MVLASAASARFYGLVIAKKWAPKLAEAAIISAPPFAKKRKPAATVCPFTSFIALICDNFKAPALYTIYLVAV